jgi:parallel beta-helix repeat protein
MKTNRNLRLSVYVFLVLFLIVNALPLKTRGQQDLPVHNLNTRKSYEAIQEAINEANIRDTIYVYNGTYYENVVVNKTVSLIGENKFNTTIDGLGKGNVVHVTADVANIKGFTIQNSEWSGDRSGVYMDRSSGGNISDNIIRNNRYGIRLYYSGENSVLNNIILSNGPAGISLTFATNNVISNNNISRNDNGILLDSSTNNIFSRNNIYSSKKLYATSLYDCLDNVFSNNTISDNEYGVYLQFCGYNTFSGNNVSKNIKGFSLISSRDNTFSGNKISYNTDYGVRLGASSHNVLLNNYLINNWNSILSDNSESNTIYHNNFINTQADTAQKPICVASVNSWDNGIEGNYWSRHDGPDKNQDGISDTAYLIDENNKDNYPLMANFTQLNIMVDNKVYAIDVVSNSTIYMFEYFSYPANRTAVLSFQVCNTTGKGFCRIRIPHALIEPPYAVIVDHNASLYGKIVCSNRTHSWLYFTYYHLEYEPIIISISSQELPVWFQWWLWTIIGLMLVVTILLLIVIKYHRMCIEQKKIIEAYELKMYAYDHLGTARAFFEADVRRREVRIKKFEKKYNVKIRPRNNFEDLITSIEFKGKEKEKL